MPGEQRELADSYASCAVTSDSVPGESLTDRGRCGSAKSMVGMGNINMREGARLCTWVQECEVPEEAKHSCTSFTKAKDALRPRVSKKCSHWLMREWIQLKSCIKVA